MKRLVIWGCGGHAREINWLCEQLGYEVLGFLDETPNMRGTVVNGIPVLGDLPDIESLRNEVEIVCAGVGDPAIKRKFVHKTLSNGFRPASSIVHPDIKISRRNKIGHGTIICEGSILTDNIEIGSYVIINRGVNVSHDVRIADYVTIAPGVDIAGNVQIGEDAYIGIGASIREKVIIGRQATVGGGAFVKDDVPERSLAVGVPAIVKKRY
ncbi:MAG: acetyltransferase [Alicyclobacillus sp.]|nr:acetyltransferase [Alicyclobacillus sp.]